MRLDPAIFKQVGISFESFLVKIFFFDSFDYPQVLKMLEPLLVGSAERIGNTKHGGLRI